MNDFEPPKRIVVTGKPKTTFEILIDAYNSGVDIFSPSANQLIKQLGINKSTRIVQEAIQSMRLMAGVEKKKVFITRKETADFNVDDGIQLSLKTHSITASRILILSDIHIPYHDKEALLLAMKYGKSKDVDAVILNGDIVDCYQVSRFLHDNKKPSVKMELDIWKAFAGQLRKYFPLANIYFKEGNHEQRLYKYMMQHAAEMAELMDFEYLMGFQDFHIQYLKENLYIKLGALNVLHGHEMQGGGINVARSFFLKMGDNILFGHFHRTQEYIQNDMHKNIRGAWATGCLCLDQDYAPLSNSNLGFAYVEVNTDGTFVVENKKIIKGKIV